MNALAIPSDLSYHKPYFGWNSKKVEKKVTPSMLKSQNSQKSWSFIAKNERPRDSARFEPPQAIKKWKKKFWIFFDFFGRIWIFLSFQVPVRNPIFWLHGVDALLFPTVLSQEKPRKKIFATQKKIFTTQKIFSKNPQLN